MCNDLAFIYTEIPFTDSKMKCTIYSVCLHLCNGHSDHNRAHLHSLPKSRVSSGPAVSTAPRLTPFCNHHRQACQS